MAAYGIDADAAYHLLRWHSQHANIKLRRIAEGLVRTFADADPDAVTPRRRAMTLPGGALPRRRPGRVELDPRVRWCLPAPPHRGRWRAGRHAVRLGARARTGSADRTDDRRVPCATVCFPSSPSSWRWSSAAAGEAAPPTAVPRARLRPRRPRRPAATATDCPTENTRSFAKTRFVADVGGALFLLNRYIVNPYQKGTFTKGADGRTAALIKAGLAAAATAKLVSNARENAKANPTLCRTVAGPLDQLAASLNGVVDGLKSGSLDAGAIGGLSGLLGSLKQKAGEAGVPVTEQPVPLG